MIAFDSGLVDLLCFLGGGVGRVKVTRLVSFGHGMLS